MVGIIQFTWQYVVHVHDLLSLGQHGYQVIQGGCILDPPRQSVFYSFIDDHHKPPWDMPGCHHQCMMAAPCEHWDMPGCHHQCMLGAIVNTGTRLAVIISACWVPL